MTGEPTSAKDDLAAARAGDEDALARLLAERASALHRLVAAELPARWRSLLAVEDVLQQTYTDAFLAVGDFVPVGAGAFEAWLARLARNNLRDAVRGLEADKRGGGARRVEARAGSSAADLLEELWRESQTSPSGRAARAEEVDALLGAIAVLPPLYADVVRALDLEGRPIGALAAELERSPGAVHLLRHRARARLRELLGAGRDATNPAEGS